METEEARKLMDVTFEEIVCVLGGILAVHNVADEAVWQIMKHIDIAHENALLKLEEPGPNFGRASVVGRSYKPHPAVEALLLKLKKREGL